MAQNVTLHIDTTRYAPPSQEDIDEGKRYARERNAAILALLASVRRMIDEATQRLVSVCYTSALPAHDFSLANIEDDLSDAVADIMDSLEEEIMIAINSAILKIPMLDSNRTQNYLALITSYLASLGHGNRSFEQTIYTYLYRYMLNVEAYVAATRLAGLPLSDAMPKILGSIGVKGAPTMQAELQQAYAVASDMTAQYIRSRGEVTDYDGSPNVRGVPRDGAMAVTNTVNIAMAMLYGQAQLWDMADGGAVGYYQLRGSNYPCAVCDGEVGLHLGDLRTAPPLPHPHCMCYRIPVYTSSPTAYRPLNAAFV